MEAEYGIKQVKITFPEGLTTEEMGNILSRALPDFDSSAFNFLTKEKEGYLFLIHIFFTSTQQAGDYK